MPISMQRCFPTRGCTMNASSDNNNSTSLRSDDGGVGSWHEQWRAPNIRIGANEAVFMFLGYSLGSLATAVCFLCGRKCRKRRRSDENDDEEEEEQKSNLT